LIYHSFSKLPVATVTYVNRRIHFTCQAISWGLSFAALTMTVVKNLAKMR